MRNAAPVARLAVGPIPGSPADDAGRRASRRSTAAFRETEISLQLRAGLPGSGIGAGPVQQAPCRAVLVPPGRGPGAARVRGYEPRPQGPHLAPSAERLRKTPLSERGGRIVEKILQTVKDYGHNKSVIGNHL